MPQPREAAGAGRPAARKPLVMTFVAILAICAAVAFVAQRALRIRDEAAQAPSLLIR